MFKFFANTSIKFKLWSGYLLLLVILAVVALVALQSLWTTRGNVTRMAGDMQPVVLGALEVDTALHNAASSLGFFLMSKEDVHRQAYEANLERLGEAMTGLLNAPYLRSDPQLRSLAEQVAEEVNHFAALRDELLTVATDLTRNMPAMQ
ncbi:MAG: MCP four helix bundle domain-containing protein, partial [Ectothiorhodospiraceae bacterium]|nr:MCP four helix bundle domain-containing protein [Ectothiorhodospiraceae bacterium]